MCGPSVWEEGPGRGGLGPGINNGLGIKPHPTAAYVPEASRRSEVPLDLTSCSSHRDDRLIPRECPEHRTATSMRRASTDLALYLQYRPSWFNFGLLMSGSCIAMVIALAAIKFLIEPQRRKGANGLPTIENRGHCVPSPSTPANLMPSSPPQSGAPSGPPFHGLPRRGAQSRPISSCLSHQDDRLIPRECPEHRTATSMRRGHYVPSPSTPANLMPSSPPQSGAPSGPPSHGPPRRGAQSRPISEASRDIDDQASRDIDDQASRDVNGEAEISMVKQPGISMIMSPSGIGAPAPSCRVSATQIFIISTSVVSTSTAPTSIPILSPVFSLWDRQIP